MAGLSTVTDKSKYLSDIATALGNVYGSPPASFILGTLDYYKKLCDKLSEKKYMLHSERLGVYALLKVILIIMKNSSTPNGLMSSAANLGNIFATSPKNRPVISAEERSLALYFYKTYYVQLLEEIKLSGNDIFMIQGNISFLRDGYDIPKECEEHPNCACCGMLASFSCECGGVAWCNYICSISMFNSHKCNQKKSD